MISFLVLFCFIIIFGIYAASVVSYIKEQEEKKNGRKK